MMQQRSHDLIKQIVWAVVEAEKKSYFYLHFRLDISRVEDHSYQVIDDLQVVSRSVIT